MPFFYVHVWTSHPFKKNICRQQNHQNSICNTTTELSSYSSVHTYACKSGSTRKVLVSLTNWITLQKWQSPMWVFHLCKTPAINVRSVESQRGLWLKAVNSNSSYQCCQKALCQTKGTYSLSKAEAYIRSTGERDEKEVQSTVKK